MASASESESKLFTLAEVRQLTEDKNKCILIIDNGVYDVTRFLDEHPGGDEVLKDQNGKDASEAFEDVGHSKDAREQMKSYRIGALHPNDAKTKKSRTPIVEPKGTNSSGAADENASWSKWVVPLVIAVAAVVLFKLLGKSPDVPRSPPTI